MFQTEDFYTGFWNSVIYTFVIIGINIPISLLGAYGFSRFNFKGKDILFWLYIVLMLMPFQATILPQYLTLRALKIIHTPSAVIIPNIFSTFGTFLIAQYMRGLNKEIFESGRIDGLNEFKLFIKMAVPMCRSIIFALTVLLFINYWSMVEQPLVFISDPQHMPLGVTLNASERFRQIAFSAGTVFSVLPILLYQFTYGDLIKGIGLSAGSDTNINTLDSKDQRERFRQKGRIKKGIIVFMVMMAAFTLLAQKITYIMTPVVEIIQAKQGDIKSDPMDKTSESLGYFNMVIPSTCIFDAGAEKYIYVMTEEKSERKRKQAMKVLVSINATNGLDSAISGGIPQKSHIIKWSTKPINEGMFVMIAEDGGGADE